MRHDLEAGDKGVLQQSDILRHRHFVQGSVHPVADAHVVFEGFDVNVRGPLADGLTENLIDEAHDGRLFIVLQHGDLLTQGIGFVMAVAAINEVFKTFRAHPVTLPQGLDDAAAGGQPPGDILIHHLADGLTGLEIEGIAGQDFNLIFPRLSRQEAMPQGKTGRHPGVEFLAGRHWGLFREGHAEGFG